MGGRVFCTNGPALTSTTVIATLSGPSSLWALTKSTGEPLWSRAFSNIAGIATDLDAAYVVTGRRIVCVDPLSGRTRWETPPWIRQRAVSVEDSVARTPTPSGNLIFWPAGGGVVACASAASGEELWRSQRRGGVASSLLVVRGMVIGTELPAAIFALDVKDGRELWARRLPNPSLREPKAAFESVLVRLKDGLLLLNATTGAVTATCSWPNEILGDVAAGSEVVFAVRCGKEDSIFQGRHAVIPRGSKILRLNSQGESLWEVESSLRGPRLVWDEGTRCLVEMCGGLAVWDINRGRRSHFVPLSDFEGHLTPALDLDRIYLTSTQGSVVALRSPAVAAGKR